MQIICHPLDILMIYDLIDFNVYFCVRRLTQIIPFDITKQISMS